MLALRLATPDDVAELTALIAQSVRVLSRPFYSPRQIESALRHVFGVDTQLIADGTYYVAADGASIAGCGGWSRRQTLYGGDQMKAQADPLLDPSTEAARIRAFFVHPDWARRGIGRLLLERCTADASAAGFRTLALLATLPGEPLYRTYGFEPTRREEVRLADGVVVPFVHMQRPIDLAQQSTAPQHR